MRTGTKAMMVDAIPVWVCCTASNEKETPRKGPKTDPNNMFFMAGRMVNVSKTIPHFFIPVTTMAKPTMPVMVRIWVEAKAL